MTGGLVVKLDAHVRLDWVDYADGSGMWRAKWISPRSGFPVVRFAEAAADAAAYADEDFASYVTEAAEAHLCERAVANGWRYTL